MSLIIDALRKAQHLRLKDTRGVPFFKSQSPPNEKRRTELGKRRLFPILCLIGLILILWIVVWNPFSSHQERKPLLSVALSEKNKSSILVTEKKPEAPAKALRSSLQEAEKPLFSSESPETKREEPLLKPVQKERKVKISKPMRRSIIGKSFLPSEEASPQPLKRSPPSKEAPHTPADETQEVLKPPSPSAEILLLFNQGVLYQNQKETAKAIQTYQRVIELDSTYFEAYNNLGLLYQELGDFDRAIQAYQKSIEINPRYEKAFNNLGILFYLKDRYEEALESFQKAIALHPGNMESYLNLGILLKKQGQGDKAMDSFQKALAINPISGETHYNIALLYEQINQIGLAIDHYQKFIQLSARTHPVLVSKVQRHLDALFRKEREKK
jgi:Flp pilus assembly protein TadD